MMNNDTPRRKLLHGLAALPLGLLGIAATSRAGAAAGDAATDLAQRVARLESAQQYTNAEQEIKRVLNLYARGWDRRDAEAIRACFWPDSTHQHGGFKGLSSDFITGGLKATGQVKSMTHMITNESIEVVGDRAVSECYFLAHHRRPRAHGEPGDEDMFIKGRYLDRFERRDGIWKIAHRRGLSDFTRVVAPANTDLDALPPEQVSAKKPDDPLYAMLAKLRE